jgi:transposase
MPKISRLEVIATGSRRRWTLEEKQRIVAESFSAPRIVSATARRHGLSNSQLFTWRRLARSGQLVGEGEDETAGFVAARIADEELVPEPAVAGSQKAVARGRMSIVLSGGRRVIVDSEVDQAALRRVLEVLERR